MSQTPTFAEMLRGAMDARLKDMHVSIPGRVTRYDASRLRVDVKPQVRRVYFDESGSRQTEELPVVPDVPVMFPGSGSFRITFPVSVGDAVLLIVSEASIDKWLGDKAGVPVDPDDDRRNQLIDSFAVPIADDYASPSAADTTDFSIGSPGASDRVARKSDLSTLKSAISGAAVTGGDGGAAFKSNILAALSSWPTDSNIKVD